MLYCGQASTSRVLCCFVNQRAEEDNTMLDTFKKATPEALAAITEEMGVRHTTELFLLFAMGSQFDHLIFQELSKLGVYCLVADPASVTAEDVQILNPTGIILSGGPASVVTEPPPFDDTIFDLGIPVLGICLGFQKWAQYIGAGVRPGPRKEFGVHDVTMTSDSPLLAGLDVTIQVLQSHGDEVSSGLPLTIHGFSDHYSGSSIVAIASHGHLYGLQFHPEVTETPDGSRIFENFCFGICGAKDKFPAHNVAERKIASLRQTIGEDRRVLVLLSGGSDSSVVTYLMKHATNGRHQLRCVYIKGIDRPDDEDFVLRFFGNQPWMELVVIDATDRFLEALAGKTQPREKRMAMRGVYKPIAEEQAALLSEDGKYDVFIAQGTLYTDISESGGGAGGARKAVIKVHHNTNLDFRFPELTPIDDCVKDGARSIGRDIGVPEELLVRHPFPGPGLVVRVEGEVTAEKLVMARHLDDIYIEELRRFGQYDLVWQAGVTVTASNHTYTKGDDAGIGPLIVYWAVWSVNGFTARAAKLPDDLHDRIVQRFGNEVAGIGAVAYRKSNKPFSTIEWS